MTEGEKLIPINIEEQMKSAYIDYSMSVIVSRALPDVRDGLKPVHRRVLFGMHELGIKATGSYKKSARIVGRSFREVSPAWRYICIRFYGKNGPKLECALHDGRWPR